MDRFDFDLYYLRLTAHTSSLKLEAAIQRLSDSLMQLEIRYGDLRHAEQHLISINDELFEHHKLGDDLNIAQRQFVNRLESYFQGMYSAISVFTMALNCLVPSVISAPEVKSQKRFLKRLKVISPGLADNIEILEQVRNFRAKRIDHPQQQHVQDWLTYVYPTQKSNPGFLACVIYFPKGLLIPPGVQPTGQFMDPYAPDFKPFIKGPFEISPQPHKARAALIALLDITSKNICTMNKG